MSTRLLACAILAAALPLGSCSAPEIDVSLRQVEGRWVATLSQDWGLFTGRKTPCIRSVALDEEDSETGIVNAGATPSVWSVYAKDGRCIDLATFTIGTTPAGFTQETPLPADTHGRYQLTVHGTGWGVATLTL